MECGAYSMKQMSENSSRFGFPAEKTAVVGSHQHPSPQAVDAIEGLFGVTRICWNKNSVPSQVLATCEDSAATRVSKLS